MLKKPASFVLASFRRTLGAHKTLLAHEDTAASPSQRRPQEWRHLFVTPWTSPAFTNVTRLIRRVVNLAPVRKHEATSSSPRAPPRTAPGERNVTFRLFIRCGRPAEACVSARRGRAGEISGRFEHPACRRSQTIYSEAGGSASCFLTTWSETEAATSRGSLTAMANVPNSLIGCANWILRRSTV